MLGVVIIVAVIVVALPVLYLMTGGLLSAVMGWSLKNEGEVTHPDSELTELNY